MSLFGLFSDKHFPVYGQNLHFSRYTGKYVSATSLYVYTRFHIYNISSRYYINVHLQFLDLHISHSTNKTHYALNVFARCSLGYPSCNKLW